MRWCANTSSCSAPSALRRLDGLPVSSRQDLILENLVRDTIQRRRSCTFAAVQVR